MRFQEEDENVKSLRTTHNGRRTTHDARRTTDDGRKAIAEGSSEQCSVGPETAKTCKQGQLNFNQEKSFTLGNYNALQVLTNLNQLALCLAC